MLEARILIIIKIQESRENKKMTSTYVYDLFEIE